MEGFELLLDDFRREIVFLLARLGLSKNIFLNSVSNSKPAKLQNNDF